VYKRVMGIRFPTGKRYICIFFIVSTGCKRHPPLNGQSGRDVKLMTHIHLVSRSIICEGIPPHSIRVHGMKRK
jgi:hypothetical protein